MRMVDRVQDMLANLPPLQREALVLQIVHDLHATHVAAPLGRKPDAIRQLQRRALASLALARD